MELLLYIYCPRQTVECHSSSSAEKRLIMPYEEDMVIVNDKNSSALFDSVAGIVTISCIGAIVLSFITFLILQVSTLNLCFSWHIYIIE